MDPNFAFLSRQDILNFPFPYKLWLVVHLECCDFLRWNRDGTVVLLDLVALEDYLNSSRSIFRIKNNSTFLKHLEEFNFDRLNSMPEAGEDVLLQYKNEYFQRHRLDLLLKIRRRQLIGEISDNYRLRNENTAASYNKSDDPFNTMKLKRLPERMLGDLCFMCHGGLSNIKKSRLHFQTRLRFNNVKRILQEKLEASVSSNSCKSDPDIPIRSSVGGPINELDQVIELPVELFENPHDSVLNFDFLPEFAGYYGNCTKDQIMQFFGEYLPMYEAGSIDMNKILTEHSTSTDSNSLSTNYETNIEQYYVPNTTVNSSVTISTPALPYEMYNINLSPILIKDENDENINVNNITNTAFTITHLDSKNVHNDDDISMDEFLKFKDCSPENTSVNVPSVEDKSFGNFDTFPYVDDNTETFPQMPSSFKMKLKEDVKENDANFRNFFSQYRASLNLLYDRQ